MYKKIFFQKNYGISPKSLSILYFEIAPNPHDRRGNKSKQSNKP